MLDGLSHAAPTAAAPLDSKLAVFEAKLESWAAEKLLQFDAQDPAKQAGLDEGLLSFSLPHSSLYGEFI
jgi:hypothetical protein